MASTPFVMCQGVVTFADGDNDNGDGKDGTNGGTGDNNGPSLR